MGSLEAIAKEEIGLSALELHKIYCNAPVDLRPAQWPDQVSRVRAAVREQHDGNPLIEILERTYLIDCAARS